MPPTFSKPEPTTYQLVCLTCKHRRKYTNSPVTVETKAVSHALRLRHHVIVVDSKLETVAHFDRTHSTGGTLF